MSFLAQEWAEDHAPVADTYERIILMKLARHASDDGTGAYPLVSTMATAALCDTETVRRRLRAMTQRGLIALGDQRLARAKSPHMKPRVYDVLIPHGWYSPEQLAKVNRERAETGLHPITPENRPPIAPAPARKRRADHGQPNPKRSPRKRTVETPLREGSGAPLDNFPRPLCKKGGDPSLSGGETPLREGHNPSVQSVQMNPSVRTPAPTPTPVEPLTGAGRTQPDGRTDDSSKAESADQSQQTPATDPAAGVSTAAKLVAAEAIQADLRRIDLLPAVKPHQRQQLGRLLGAVDHALLRFPEAKVVRYLAEKAAAAHTVKFLLAAFTEYSNAIRDVQVPALDDQRDATVLGAVAAAAARLAPPAPEVPEVPEHDLSSPVVWLTDEQFAALSHQDRAYIRVAAEIPFEQLRPRAAARVRAIRQAVEAVPA